VRVESWLELQECLFADSWHSELGRYRSDFVYRGESDAANELTTSLMRLGGDYASVEQHLLRSFRKYAPQRSVQVDSVWNWLALAKHHSLPTRLLDWSYSPYVALHFVTASASRFDVDGAVWMVDFVQAQEQLPKALRKALEEEGGNAFTAETLATAAPTLRDFDRLGDDFVVFFEPPSLDERIVNQYGLFSLMPDPDSRLDRWLEAHPELVRRIVVPAGLKWELRDKLDQANVTERVLFPGLDGLTAWLKRYYSPREPAGEPERSASSE
jgi:hypothetical protein